MVIAGNAAQAPMTGSSHRCRAAGRALVTVFIVGQILLLTQTTPILTSKRSYETRVKEHTNLDKPTRVGDHCIAKKIFPGQLFK